MVVEPPYSSPQGPQSISPDVLRAVNREIERHHGHYDENPEKSNEDDDYWILGMAPDEVPPLYRLPKPHAVYVIMCQNVGENIIRERADFFNVDVSDGFINEYKRWGTPYYVGYTMNPYRRVNEHWDGLTGGAWYTKLLPPQSLQQILWFDDEDAAKLAEKNTANKIQQKAGGFINPSLLD